MRIDCDTCVVRDTAEHGACGDCVITVLLGAPPPERVDLDDAERRALGSLAGAGLVPPLRLVPVLSRDGREIA